MGSRGRLIALFLILLSFLHAQSASVADQTASPKSVADLQIMKQGELKAFVSAAGWCKEVVHAIIRAPGTEPFQGDRITLQRMIGHLRIALATECPQATSILIDGFGADLHVYSGMATQASEWVLEETTTPPAIADAAAECSALAAHPDDPEKDTSTGVPDEDINADMAREACSDAIAEHPDDPVYRFQLARAYWKSEQFAVAIESLLTAAEDDHGGALAYLADAVLYGLGGLEVDPELAKQLYTRAAEEGFEPAAAVAQQIEADPRTEEDEIALDIAREATQAGGESNQEKVSDSPVPRSSQSGAVSEAAKQPFQPSERRITPPQSKSDPVKMAGVAKASEPPSTRLAGKSQPDQGDYAFPKLIAALANGNATPEGVWPGRMLVYSFASVASVVDRCPDLKPQGFDAKDGFLRAMNTKLTYTEKLSLTESYEKGDMAELQESASRDGARLAEIKGCAAPETRTLVKTVAAHYAAG